jgi:hypothetical protein
MLDRGRCWSSAPKTGVVRPLGLLELVTEAREEGRAKMELRCALEVRLEGRLGVVSSCELPSLGPAGLNP